MSRRSSRVVRKVRAWDPNGERDALDPAVGTIFRLTRSGEGVQAGDVLVRLAGFREHTGNLRFCLISCDRVREARMEYPSTSFRSASCEEVQLASLSRGLQRAVSAVLVDPPTEGLFARAPRHERVPLPMSASSQEVALATPLPISTRSLRDILHENAALPALPLDYRHYAYRVLQRWGFQARTPRRD